MPPMMPTETVTPRHAIPAYPVRHSGSVLILGYGFTLHDDYARARRLRPDADVIAVNKAAVEYKADHLFSPHWAEPEYLPTWVATQRDKFGDGFLVHSTPGRNHETGNLNPVPENKPPEDALSRRDLRNGELIDHWWPGAITNLALADGTGGWMAVRMACFMGYEERILCGVPMERGGHADGGIRTWKSSARIGLRLTSDQSSNRRPFMRGLSRFRASPGICSGNLNNGHHSKFVRPETDRDHAARSALNQGAKEILNDTQGVLDGAQATDGAAGIPETG